MNGVNASIRRGLRLVGDDSEIVGWFMAHKAGPRDAVAGVLGGALDFLMRLPAVGSEPQFEYLITFTEDQVSVLHVHGVVRAEWTVERTGVAHGAFGELDVSSYEPNVDVLGVRYQIRLTAVDEVKALRRRFA